jgi:hypothetical protein
LDPDADGADAVRDVDYAGKFLKLGKQRCRN